MSEIKKPTLKRPRFFNEDYDYRNKESVGPYNGVGEAGKVGSLEATSIDPCPPKAHTMRVPRDHHG